MSDFFDDTKGVKVDEPVQTEPEKIKLGETEYTQDELSRLVGLGQTASELEKNYGKLDKVMSDYGRRADEIGRLKRENEEFKTKQVNLKVENQQQLSPEELKQLAKQQAKELGLMTTEDFNQTFDQMYVTRRAAEKLVEDTETVIEEATSKGQPAITREDLLKYMQESGMRNPAKAYKDKFEVEIDKWKEEQTKKATVPGMFSPSGSTAGGKTPPAVQITKDNLTALVHEALGGGGE